MWAQDHILTKFIDDKFMTFWIPPYQRNYNWSWKKEINVFIDDIKKFEMDDLDNYFLGSIILKQRNKNEYTLVDGQQRITTLLLMCSALYDLLKLKKQESSTLGLRIYTILESDKNKFKLMRINDENIIENIMVGNSSFLTDEQQKSNYFSVYKHFKSFFMKEINEKDGIEKIENFFYNGILKIKVAIIILDNKEDEFLVFESINSKGKNLSSVDLIKNYVMMSLTDSELEEELQKKFENIFIAKITKMGEEEKIKNLLANLYRQNLAIETGVLYPLNGKNLYYGFKKWIEKENKKINELFINGMLYDLAICKYIIKNVWNNKALPLIKGQLMTFYSIIHLTVKENSNFENDEFKILNKKNIEYVANYLSKLIIARTLCYFTQGNKDYARLAHQLKEEFNKFDKTKFKNIFQKVVIKKLETITNKYRMPARDEIEKTPLEKNVPLNLLTLKWILIAIEQNKSKMELSNPQKISIEHIFPQKPSYLWKHELSKNEMLMMNSKLHNLGNLSITYHNGSLSNKTASQKKKILADKSYLKTNKWFYEEDVWNSQAIEKRTKKLLKEIFDLWWN